MQYANCAKFEFEIENCLNDVHAQSTLIQNFQSLDIKIQRTASCNHLKKFTALCLLVSFYYSGNVLILIYIVYSQIHGAYRGEGAASALMLLATAKAETPARTICGG